MNYRLFVYLIILTIANVNFSLADECIKFEKLSKEYAKCKAELIKEKTTEKAELIKKKTAEKAELIKAKTSEKYNDGKKKFNKLNLKDKLIKFKNSKSHKEFMEKLKNEN
ncbi:hypothetical protein [Candidatus Pelagibacter sp. HIMB1695]|uniref:hypothetical protein n=1 Tax=Candidatus Pelagibacter sp. HIMB1695 TaxID=3413364 RepID=UPI003F85D356